MMTKIHIYLWQDSGRRREEKWSSGGVQRCEEERLHDDQLLIGPLKSEDISFAVVRSEAHSRVWFSTDLLRQCSRIMQIRVGFIK